MSPEDVARRRAAKRFNERLKLAAAFLNNSGIAILVGGFVLPLANAPEAFGILRWLWFLVPLLLHVTGQLVLSLMKSED